MDEIPFKERRVIDELVEFWQAHCEPPNLPKHIRSTIKPERERGKIFLFFVEIYNDLYNGKWSKHSASSASEFKQVLENRYRQLDEEYKEKVRADKEKARADFDALGKEIVNAATRAERIELGRRRVALAPSTGISYIYENHCWSCHGPISSAIHAQCLDCKGYICTCGACFC